MPYLDVLGIPADKLPALDSPGTVLGGISAAASAETGLPEGTPVVLGCFDHPSAARGAGILEEGQLLLSCGTSWVGFFPLCDRTDMISRRMLVDPFLTPDGPWGGMISIPAIAASIDRILAEYISGSMDRYQELDRLAAQAKPGAGGLRIDLSQDCQPAGLEQYGRESISRALMEAAVYELKRAMNGLERAVIVSAATMVGGPSEMHTWPQIISDVLGIPVSVAYGAYSGAVGAAMLAGAGVGEYTDFRVGISATGHPIRTFQPNMKAHEIYATGMKA